MFNAFISLHLGLIVNDLKGSCYFLFPSSAVKCRICVSSTLRNHLNFICWLFCMSGVEKGISNAENKHWLAKFPSKTLDQHCSLKEPGLEKGGFTFTPFALKFLLQKLLNAE